VLGVVTAVAALTTLLLVRRNNERLDVTRD
jgi:hypothetical protein